MINVMKKRLFLIGIPVILALTGVFLSVMMLREKEFLLLQTPFVIQERPLVTYTEGECFYKIKDGEWTPLETGERLSSGTGLKTGASGRIDIRLSRENLIRMGENAVTDLDRITAKSISLRQGEGQLYAKFHKLFRDQSFRVETANTVAGIRGTELVVDAREGETLVYALSGITEIRSTTACEPILLSYNSFTRVRDGQAPSSPQKMNEEQVVLFRDRINAIHSEQVVHISHSLLFEPNSAVMLDESRPELEQVFALLEKTRYSVEIGGHTALVGDAAAMYSLSLARAEAVRDELTGMGIRAKRLSVQGYGAARPVADNDTEEGRALNRRVEFIVTEP